MFSGFRSVWMRLRSCKTDQGQYKPCGTGNGSLTSNTGEKLPGKALNLTARERHKSVALEEVENALAQQIRDYTYVVSVVEAVAKVYAFVAIVFVVHGKS